MKERSEERPAHGIVAVYLDYETVDSNGGMLMVTASGTAVKF